MLSESNFLLKGDTERVPFGLLVPLIETVVYFGEKLREVDSDERFLLSSGYIKQDAHN